MDFWLQGDRLNTRSERCLKVGCTELSTRSECCLKVGCTELSTRSERCLKVGCTELSTRSERCLKVGCTDETHSLRIYGNVAVIGAKIWSNFNHLLSIISLVQRRCKRDKNLLLCFLRLSHTVNHALIGWNMWVHAAELSLQVYTM